VPVLNQLYQQYRDRAEFYVVYIREAHPSDAWQLRSNIQDKVVFASPKTFEEKGNLANLCVTKLGIQFPALIDNFDNATETAYTAWPDRLYLIDRKGRIAYKSEPGPFGFKPDELAAAIRSELSQSN
jgi:type I thyroxine 5'-deiodinase